MGLVSESFHGPYPGFLEKYATAADGRYSFSTLEKAIEAAATAPKCRGITREADGAFTLRKKRKLHAAKNGEQTWVRHGADVNKLHFLHDSASTRFTRMSLA